MTVFSLRSGCTPSRSSSRSQENGSSTKYSWLPVTKNVPSRESKSRNGSAAEPSSSTVPSTTSPTIATRSGAVSLIIRTIRSVRARPDSGPRWMSETTAIRNPLKRRIQSAQSYRHLQQVGRTRARGRADPDKADRRRAGGHRTGPGEKHPPVHCLRRRRGLPGGGIGRGRRSRRRWLLLHPAPQREPDGLQHEQRQEQVRRQGRTRSSRATRTTPTRSARRRAARSASRPAASRAR